MTPEGKIKAKFAKLAKQHGITYINLITTGSRGDPDKMVLLPGGKMFFLEFKSSTGRLSENQKVKIQLYESLGFAVGIINSMDAVDEIIGHMVTYLESTK